MEQQYRLAFFIDIIQQRIDSIFVKLKDDPSALNNPLVKERLEQLIVRLAKFEESIEG